MILSIDDWFKDDDRIKFIAVTTELLKLAIEDYCDDVDADDYNVDIESAIKYATTYDIYEDADEVNDWEAEKYIIEEVEEAVKDEIRDKIKDMPYDIIVSKTFIDKLSIGVYGADNLVDSYFKDNFVFECHEPEINDDSEIDSIFQREHE